MKKLFMSLIFAALLFATAPAAAALEMPGQNYTLTENNLHQVDGPPPDGQRAFRLYRSGSPDRATFAKWCEVYNVERVVVMSGDAATHELRYQAEGICPQIQILYDSNQRWDLPVSSGFLEWFDREVARAQADNAGVLIRCKTGSHRTGRLAAWYEMKYMGKSCDQAITTMNRTGTLMPFFGMWLVPQVRALDDHLRDRKCPIWNLMCVR